MKPIVTAFIVICILAISCLAIVLVMKHLHPPSPPSPPPSSPPSPPPSSDDKLKKDLADLSGKIETAQNSLAEIIKVMTKYQKAFHRGCSFYKNHISKTKFNCGDFDTLLNNLNDYNDKLGELQNKINSFDFHNCEKGGKDALSTIINNINNYITKDIVSLLTNCGLGVDKKVDRGTVYTNLKCIVDNLKNTKWNKLIGQLKESLDTLNNKKNFSQDCFKST